MSFAVVAARSAAAASVRASRSLLVSACPLAAAGMAPRAALAASAVRQLHQCAPLSLFGLGGQKKEEVNTKPIPTGAMTQEVSRRGARTGWR